MWVHRDEKRRPREERLDGEGRCMEDEGRICVCV
jgi:hypothetical protein